MPSPSRSRSVRLRRATFGFLLALGVATAGCSTVLPANTPPSDIPPQPPQFVCETAWDVPNGTVTVTITKGTAVSLDPAAAVAIRGDVRDPPQYWVTGGDRPAAAQDGPLEPGDEISVDLADVSATYGATEADVDVVWSVEDGSSAVICASERRVGGGE
jgi:hypothetical protein